MCAEIFTPGIYSRVFRLEKIYLKENAVNDKFIPEALQGATLCFYSLMFKKKKIQENLGDAVLLWKVGGRGNFHVGE